MDKHNKKQIYDCDSAKTFMSKLNIQPYRSGRLDGLTFTLKDLIDIAGTSNGVWRSNVG